jgi:hypothetical protein
MLKLRGVLVPSYIPTTNETTDIKKFQNNCKISKESELQNKSII